MPRPGWRLGTVVVLAVLLAGCGSGTPSAASHHPTTTTSPTAGPSPSQKAASAALAAYRAMWADVTIASRTADYQSLLLPQHAAGQALSTFVRNLYTFQHEGLVIKGAPLVHPQVVSMSPTTDPTAVAIVDCFNDTNWLDYKASGGLQNNVPGGHRRVTAALENMGGIWKVTQITVGAEGTC
ncbi:MAG: hypothetical protein ACYDD4_05270 [Acidimicrobiales bacterium]